MFTILEANIESLSMNPFYKTYNLFKMMLCIKCTNLQFVKYLKEKNSIIRNGWENA